MAEKQFRNNLYIKEIYQKLKNIAVEQPIIDQYYSDIRSKIKPTIQELPPNPNENQLRNILTNELSPILKNQTSNFIENLKNSNDLIAFYKFGPDFLNQIKDIRDIDSNFLSDLWNKYKSRMLNDDSDNIPELLKEKLPRATEIVAPYGLTSYGKPREKAGRKPKDSKSTDTRANIIQQLRNSPLFKAKQDDVTAVPAITLSGHGIHKMHHHTLKKTVGRGIAGETHVNRR